MDHSSNISTTVTPGATIAPFELTEINMTALVSIEQSFKDKKEELEKIILVKVPAETYPILYETFIYLFTQAGIKNISIAKEVDFEKMYNEKKKN